MRSHWKRSFETDPQNLHETVMSHESVRAHLLYCSGGFNALFFSSKHFDPLYFIKISYYLTVRSLEFQQICLLTSWFSPTILLLTSFPTSSKFSFFHSSLSVFILFILYSSSALMLPIPRWLFHSHDRCWFECITEIGNILSHSWCSCHQLFVLCCCACAGELGLWLGSLLGGRILIKIRAFTGDFLQCT